VLGDGWVHWRYVRCGATVALVDADNNQQDPDDNTARQKCWRLSCPGPSPGDNIRRVSNSPR